MIRSLLKATAGKVSLNQSRKSGKDAGLTLLECLVALFVIQAVVAVSAPLVVLAVSTRVQNQRADQALQIAQGEIDRIKTAVARGEDFKTEIADIPTAKSRLDFTDVIKAPPPNSVPNDVTDTSYKTDPLIAKPVDINNDSEPDFAVQVFRNNIEFIDGPSAAANANLAAFDVAVRVYQADAVQTRAADLEIEQAPYGFAGGTPTNADNEDSQVLTRIGGANPTRPLAVMTASVFKSDTGDSLCDYYAYLEETTGSAVPAECS